MRWTWLLVVALTGCGVADSAWTEAEDGAANAEAALSGPVRLVEAHAVIGTTRNGQWLPYVSPLQDLGYGPSLASLARGVVRVATASPDARVFIHTESHLSNEPRGAWKVLEASRVDAHRFEFATEPISLGGGFHYIPRFVHTFAVELRTAQGSQWDNNGGQDYVVSGDDDGGWVPVWAGPTAVLTGNLVVERAWWDGAMLRGTVVVRNVGYGKKVRVVASTSAWKGKVEAEASYVKTFSSSDLERWSFEVAAPVTDLEVVAFAASLERPDGRVEWDNNVGRDYSLRLDGVGSPWALGPVQRPGRIVFDGPANGWAARVDVAPPADGAFTLVYDPARLPQCRGVKYGLPAWGIVAYVRRGDSFVSQSFASPVRDLPAGGQLHTQVLFAGDARSLELYFFNSDVWSCRTWDSNYGQNFVLRW
jgi:hypothetical protein